MIRKTIFTVFALILAAVLAGCASPDESGGGDTGLGDPTGVGDGGGLGGNTTDDGTGLGDSNGTTVTGSVVIDGYTYECDDTLDNDGICDEYQWDEQGQATGSTDGGQTYTSTDGTVTVNGTQYECDDTNNLQTGTNGPPCEKYVKVQ